MGGALPGKAKGTPPGGRVPPAGPPSAGSRGGERGQGLAHLALAQALERAVAELPDALARDPQDVADLLQRVLAPALQAEVELQHLGVAGLQRAQRALH